MEKNEKINEAELIERAFLELVVSRVVERGICFSEFATQVWPELSGPTAIGKFREMRHGAWKTKKPQKITISAAYRMADFLDEDLGYLLSVAKERVKRTDFTNNQSVFY